MSNNSTIKCPNCQHEFPIGNALAKDIENDIKSRYLKKYQEDKIALEQEKSKLLNEAEFLKKQAESQQKIIDEKVTVLKHQLQQEAIKKAADEMKMQLDILNKELEEKGNKLKESQQKELLLIQKEKALKEKEEEMTLELEKKLLEKEKDIADKIRKIEAERNELKIKEYEKKLSDQKDLIETMKRKAEQGSMQLQGEVQELALEDLLRSNYPFDDIEEVGKGVKGADCVQIVKNSSAQICGRIIYESKRTKAFANEWIEKLKTDMRSMQADIGVIVTETLPKDMEQFGLKDGIWICRFHEIKAVSYLLRDGLVKVSAALVSQENKGDKMQMLYDYLTGNEFKQQIEAIVEGFVSLKEGITKERMQMEKIWKEREKQLEKVLLNTTHFYGSVKGIAGNAVGDIKFLE
ncbi:MAG: DUF2130 domain-containing protein [Bacteroidia bacterium]